MYRVICVFYDSAAGKLMIVYRDITVLIAFLKAPVRYTAIRTEERRQSSSFWVLLTGKRSITEDQRIGESDFLCKL
jgi:hypothetical protein